MVEFKSEAHRETFEKTREFLGVLLGEVNVKLIGESFAMQEGSTFVYARPFAIGKKRAGVEIFSYVAVGVDVTPELMRHLLTYNLRLIMGGFGLMIGEDGKAAVILTHTILGDSMDQDELFASLSSVARVADELDDQIVKAFGGKTALGKLVSAQHPALEYWE